MNNSFLSSRSVAMHLLRGLAGIVLLWVALYEPEFGWSRWLAAAGALLCFRGCPMCWIIGLVETVIHRKSHMSCSL